MPRHSHRAPRPSRLKAERIQSFLTENPAWRLAADGRSLAAAISFADPAHAVGRVAWMMALATCHGQAPRICIQSESIQVELSAANDDFSAEEIAFARALGLSTPPATPSNTAD